MGFENIEVLLVDDKSSDKTPDLITELSQKYENVKSKILEENTGTASGPRNRGIKESSADYVIFLDNDDITDISYDNGGQVWVKTLSRGVFRVENTGIDNALMEKLKMKKQIL